ncbi:MAG: T9SS type A sorting domain-containing protein [Ignavibacteria bacterium]|nr:T9SS type A sorting domain-containing protein [Ignavibacteria bacterium]
MKILKFTFLLLFAFCSNVNANIRNVPSQYSTIQSAINSSSAHDTVLVQTGTYFENINFRGRNIVLTSRFYQNNEFSFIQNTVINGSTPVYPDTGSCVIISGGEDSTCVLQGFTITGGTGTKWQDEHGAGLYREGGGILVAYSNPVIQNNIITGNSAIPGGVTSTGGGGLRIGDCYCRVFNNIISNNTARYGAGIVLNYTGGEYRNNVVCRNYGSQDYGAGSGFWINNNYSRPKIIENNTIVSNSAIAGTPGVLGFSGAQGSLRNNIVWGNTSITVTQISGSSLSVTYSDVQNGYAGAGNINLNPSFDSTNYYLSISSPCIDKGDSSTAYNDPPEQGNPTAAKWPSRGSIRNDMGAYGGPGSRVIANTTVSAGSNSELIIQDNGFILYQNYPNPFNPSTKINFELNFSGFVTLKVFDVTGIEVAVLVNEKINPGNHSVVFNAVELPGGVYFYKLETGNFSESRKMLLIK